MDLSSPVSRAALLVLVEGALLVLLAAGYAVAGVVGEPESRVGTELGALFIVLAGLALLVVARGLSRVQGWARSPAVVVQALALPVGFSLAGGGVWLVAVPVLALALLVLWQLLTPAAGEAFREAAGRERD